MIPNKIPSQAHRFSFDQNNRLDILELQQRLKNVYNHETMAEVQQALVPWKMYLVGIGNAYTQAARIHNAVLRQQDRTHSQYIDQFTTKIIAGTVASAFGPLSPLVSVILDSIPATQIIGDVVKGLVDRGQSEVTKYVKGIVQDQFSMTIGVGNRIVDQDSPERVTMKLDFAALDLEHTVLDHLKSVSKGFRNWDNLQEFLLSIKSETGLAGRPLVQEALHRGSLKIKQSIDAVKDEIEFPEVYRRYLYTNEGFDELVIDMEKRMWADWIISQDIGHPKARNCMNFLDDYIGHYPAVRMHRLGIIDLGSHWPDCLVSADYLKFGVGKNIEAEQEGRHIRPFFPTRTQAINLRKWAIDYLNDQPIRLNDVVEAMDVHDHLKNSDLHGGWIRA